MPIVPSQLPVKYKGAGVKNVYSGGVKRIIRRLTAISNPEYFKGK